MDDDVEINDSLASIDMDELISSGTPVVFRLQIGRRIVWKMTTRACKWRALKHNCIVMNVWWIEHHKLSEFVVFNSADVHIEYLVAFKRKHIAIVESKNVYVMSANEPVTMVESSSSVETRPKRVC